MYVHCALSVTGHLAVESARSAVVVITCDVFPGLSKFISCMHAEMAIALKDLRGYDVQEWEG
jgi:hypothetical protein